MVMLTDRLDMTIIVDWDVKPKTIQNKKIKLLTFYVMTPSFRGVSARNFAEEKKMVCVNLREISRSFLRESLRLRIFVLGVNAKKELFPWADLCVELWLIEHTYHRCPRERQ